MPQAKATGMTGPDCRRYGRNDQNYYEDRRCLIWGVQHRVEYGLNRWYAFCNELSSDCWAPPWERENPDRFWCDEHTSPTPNEKVPGEPQTYSQMVAADTECCVDGKLQQGSGCPTEQLPPSPPPPPPLSVYVRRSPPPAVPPPPSLQPNPPAPQPSPPPEWAYPPVPPSPPRGDWLHAHFLDTLPQLPPLMPPRPRERLAPLPPLLPPVDIQSAVSNGFGAGATDAHHQAPAPARLSHADIEAATGITLGVLCALCLWSIALLFSRAARGRSTWRASTASDDALTRKGLYHAERGGEEGEEHAERESGHKRSQPKAGLSTRLIGAISSAGVALVGAGHSAWVATWQSCWAGCATAWARLVEWRAGRHSRQTWPTRPSCETAGMAEESLEVADDEDSLPSPRLESSANGGAPPAPDAAFAAVTVTGDDVLVEL